ncbi:MAG: orotate phosphoribosyltransferase [Burkholderiaceae bacterium]|nr:MAG: orotate phosphoribosyltransferase [Burkholderiaceae bacterium]
MNSDNDRNFLEFVLSSNVLSFGKFKTKAGRDSPYFFNTGKFSNGKLLATLADFYAKKIIYIIKHHKLSIDCLYGPAYKGIPLVSAITVTLYHYSLNLEIAYDRKEEKTHGEGGQIVGDVNGKNVLIIDDVISAGLSSKRAIEFVRKQNGNVSGILVALDRMERGESSDSENFKNTTEEIMAMTGVPVFSLADLSDLKNCGRIDSDNAKQIDLYIQKYGSCVK